MLSDTKELNTVSIFDNQRHDGSTQYTAAIDGEHYGGGMQVDLKRNARDYSFDLSYTEVSPTFQAQDGFITSTNMRVLSYWHGYWVYFNGSVEGLFTARASRNSGEGAISGSRRLCRRRIDSPWTLHMRDQDCSLSRTANFTMMDTSSVGCSRSSSHPNSSSGSSAGTSSS